MAGPRTQSANSILHTLADPLSASTRLVHHHTSTPISETRSDSPWLKTSPVHNSRRPFGELQSFQNRSDCCCLPGTQNHAGLMSWGGKKNQKRSETPRNSSANVFPPTSNVPPVHSHITSYPQGGQQPENVPSPPSLITMEQTRPPLSGSRSTASKGCLLDQVGL